MKSLLDCLTESLNNSVDFIKSKIQKNTPFFVENENYRDAKRVAHDLGYNVMSVFLDEIELDELAGTPNNGKIDFPRWVEEIANNKNKKYAVFFIDKEGKATPDAMNAIMPIILQREICGKKFDNFIPAVIAPSLANLPKPLQSKLK